MSSFWELSCLVRSSSFLDAYASQGSTLSLTQSVTEKDENRVLFRHSVIQGFKYKDLGIREIGLRD